MASKFKNCLVGAITLITLGIIILPNILDGKKKHYQDEFSAIPLLPSPSYSDEIDATLPDSQQLPLQLLEEIDEVIVQSKHSISTAQSSMLLPDITNRNFPQSEILAPLKIKVSPLADTKSEIKFITQPESRPMHTLPTLKFNSAPTTNKQAPKGQAWVVQLGALKNAKKVSEIVARLRLSGYRVYTAPSVPIQGEITRIFIGPDASQDKLQNILGELNKLSGLDGQLRPYSIGKAFPGQTWVD